MGIDARLVIKPNIHLHDILLIANSLTGLTLNRAIDNSPKELSDPSKLILTLMEFSCPGSALLELAGHELFFLNYVFICHSDKDTLEQTREWTNLFISSADTLSGGKVFFAGGNLLSWREAVIECCCQKALHNTRILFDKIMIDFEHLGLGQIWHDKRKKMLADQTFLLEDKR